MIIKYFPKWKVIATALLGEYALEIIWFLTQNIDSANTAYSHHAPYFTLDSITCFQW